MQRRPQVQQAFDEVRFGSTRILNVRDALLSGAEAVRRADGWLRAKQVEHAGEVLVITGRGNGSEGQVPVVREDVRRLLTRLRHAGVVSEVQEHTPGSFAIRLAPLRALFEAPARNRARASAAPSPSAPADPRSLEGLEVSTRALLRRLAVHSLESLGMRHPDERFVATEMERKFAILAHGASQGALSDNWMRLAIERALQEYEEER
ncbi:MAG: hypothetical protein ABIZ91_18025 [Gemmatimonadaceae bacterium]